MTKPSYEELVCECCGQKVQGRRRRCTNADCGKLCGQCCQGDIKPFECSGCYSKRNDERQAMSKNHGA
jgi:hypothetical protein